MRARWLVSGLAALVVAAGTARGDTSSPRLRVPDVALVDQAGETRHVYHDLVEGHIVAFNFIFTSCTTICQPMAATFARVQGLVHDPRVRLVSVSIDPETDTPQRLAEWARRFDAGPSWTLLTGSAADVDTLRKALGVYTPDRATHAPTVVIVDDPGGRVVRADGLGSAQALADAIDALARPSAAPASASATASYFKDLPLVDQDGRGIDLYDDVLRGHVVVIQSFFASCEGSCPVMAGNLLRLQKRFGADLGKKLVFASITVDPEHDTPEQLKAYGAKLGAAPGWMFLSGTRAQVDAALGKLGLFAETRDAHKNLVLIGNEPTGLWKKAMGLAPSEALGDIVETVLDDQGQ
jgi:protein SCO1